MATGKERSLVWFVETIAFIVLALHSPHSTVITATGDMPTAYTPRSDVQTDKRRTLCKVK